MSTDWAKDEENNPINPVTLPILTTVLKPNRLLRAEAIGPVISIKNVRHRFNNYQRPQQRKWEKKKKDIAIPEINDIPLTIEKTQATLAAGWLKARSNSDRINPKLKRIPSDMRMHKKQAAVTIQAHPPSGGTITYSSSLTGSVALAIFFELMSSNVTWSWAAIARLMLHQLFKKARWKCLEVSNIVRLATDTIYSRLRVAATHFSRCLNVKHDQQLNPRDKTRLISFWHRQPTYVFSTDFRWAIVWKWRQL